MWRAEDRVAALDGVGGWRTGTDGVVAMEDRVADRESEQGAERRLHDRESKELDGRDE